MKKLLLLLLLIPLQSIPVQAMPIAGGMVAQIGDIQIKSIDGNLFEIRKDGKASIEKLIKSHDNTYYIANNPDIKFNIRRLKKEFKVTFPEINVTEKVLEGERLPAPEAIKKQGYIFKGWDKKLSDITANLEVNAVWEAKTYNVTFKDNGKVIDTQEIRYGQEAKAPHMSDEAGRTFDGWDKSLTIKEDTVINAKWTAKKYNVSFIDDLNNKSVEQSIEYMNDAKPPEPAAVQGYEFIGWDTDTKMITDNLETHAIWKEKNGKIQFCTIRKPKGIKTIKTDEVLDLVSKNEEGRVYGDYNILQKTRDNINSEYFYYFSMIDCSLKEDKKGFYLEINSCKERFDKNVYIKEKIKEITEKIMHEGMTEENGIKALNEWFNTNFKYISGVHNLYDAFSNNGGNCDAYAQITQAICDYAGIECKYITGYVPQGYHAWNKIKLNNKWYYADFSHNKQLQENLWEGYETENEKYYFDKAN